ncbi:hypothetical protein bcgnr5378_04890 [Bacillus cereus]|uniref:Uncharacterized protein n=1 Tax=Bacillus cereus TaxID=1396 RepID=A0A161TPJ7_BACCE|nr:hypothetical protein [Bacillus cereus]KZD55728.1 hypothetical protein B4088_5473 [Bacillus cereus]
MNKKFFVGLSLAAMMTAFVPAMGGNTAHAEGEKLWDPIPKELPDLGGSFLGYDFVYESKGEYTIENKLVLSENNMLYDLDGRPTGAWISPQTVTVPWAGPQRDYPDHLLNMWYTINTWMGDKKVYRYNVDERDDRYYEYEIYRPKTLKGSEIFKKITSTNIVPLYNAPQESGEVVGSIAPQELTVTSVALADREWNGLRPVPRQERYFKGFIGVDTWVGEKWISVDDLKGETIEKYVYLADATDAIKLLDYPGHYTNSATAGNPKIAPQKVYAIQKVGEYTQIRTWLGDKWVKSNAYITDESLTDGVIALKEDYVVKKYETNYYNSPNTADVADVRGIKYYPPAIKTSIVYKKNNGEVWYLSKFGKWLKDSDIEVGQKVNRLYALKTTGQLYKKEFERTMYKVDPQNVSAKYVVGGWYLIDTWLGEMWVQM